MKFVKTLLLFSFLLLSFMLSAQQIKIKTGIEVLKEQNFGLLKGKRVGLITNPTGVDNHLKLTIDILHESPEVNLVALFAPEHGVRGEAHAGDNIRNTQDLKTGLPVHSLYGRSRKPTPEMLKEIDVLVYDIQDIGCRSFTYISTMGLAMEAAAESNIDFVVLDRPNPLGGLKVEGGLVEDKFISFVSQYKIPYVYGLTCGELAILLNEEGMMKQKCNLQVVAMQGWQRNMTYEDTGLQWIPSSPHIPQPISAILYPASGILGELGYISIGVGYTIPFQLFGAKWIEAGLLANNLNALKLPGITFRPIHFKPFYALDKGEHIQGVQVHITDYHQTRLSEIQFYVMQEIAELYPGKAVFDNANKERFSMFDKVCGSDFVRIQFGKNNRFDDIKDFWYRDIEPFKEISRKYYLYDIYN